MIKKGTILLCLVLCCCFARAQSLRPDKAVSRIYTSKTDNGANTASAKYYLIQTLPNDKSALHRYHLLKKLGPDTYIVSSHVPLGPSPGIISAEAANALWKASDGLAKAAADHPSRTSLVNIALRNTGKQLIDELRRRCTVVTESNNILTVRIQLRDLPSVLTSSNVLFAESARTPHEELSINNIDLSVNNISAIRGDHPDLNGNGINVSLKEQSYDMQDLDLLGRSFETGLRSTDLSSHATIMATLIGGNGNSFIKGLGAAPMAKFTSSDFSRLLPDNTATFADNKISIQNHSYGTGIENYYGIEAAAYDKQLYEDDTLVHVFSSGNIGTSAPVSGSYNGIVGSANLSGTFKQAKNVIVVGGTGRTDIPEALSSSGPAYDGRIKPEMVANGEDGTSGAAALTSGAVALIQQAYKRTFGKLPPNALVRSVLINSADDIGPAEVDHKTGYGKLNALEAVRTVLSKRIITGKISNANELTFPLIVPANCRRLKLSLAWADPPAQLNAASALINDLDLDLRTPNGETIMPWVLSSYPNTDSLAKAAVRGRDTLNNAEQITLNNPTPGTYTISVKGRRVIAGEQNFFVTYDTRAADQFEWTYPVQGSQFIAGEDTYLRWTSTYPTMSAPLSISYDNGQTWQPLATAQLPNGYFLSTAASVFSKAKLKVTINGQDYISGEFTISTPLLLNVGSNCTDGAYLHWPPQPGAAGYNVYSIKNNILQQVMSVTDTAAFIPLEAQPSKLFAVSAYSANLEGLKSRATDIGTQGVGCYVRTLLAAVTSPKSIELSLSLGTTYNLKSITWQKLTGPNTYVNIGTTLAQTSVINYTFIDPSPKTGINYYRVALTTTTGATTYSDLANAVLLQPRQFTVFPNPVISQVTVLSSDLNAYQLKLYDMSGLIRLNKTFNGLQNTIPVDVMPGAYLYTISADGKILYKGKLIKIR